VWHFTASSSAVTKDSLSFTGWTLFLNAPAGSDVEYVFDCATAGYKLYKSAANTMTLEGDGYSETYDVTGLWVAGAWVHVAAVVVKASDTLKLYINGSEVSSASTAGTWGSNSPGTFYLGTDTTATYTLDGYQCHVALANRELTSTEVGKLAAGAPPNEVASGDLTAYWRIGDDLTSLAPGGYSLTAVGTQGKISWPYKIASRSPRDALVTAQNPVVKEGFEGIGFENSGWTIVAEGTNDVDEDVMPPGSPSWAGVRCLRLQKSAATDTVCCKRALTWTSGRLWVRMAFRYDDSTGASPHLLMFKRTGNINPSAYVWVWNDTLRYTRYQTGESADYSCDENSISITDGEWYELLLHEDIGTGYWFIKIDNVIAGEAGISVSDLGSSGNAPLVYTTDQVSLFAHAAVAGSASQCDLYYGAFEIRTDREPSPLREEGVVFREGFETGYEGSWSETGSEDADTYFDEAATRPTYAPEELGTYSLQVKHANGDDEIYVSRTLSAVLSKSFTRVYFMPTTLSSTAILYVQGYGASATTWYWLINNTYIKLYAHDTSGWVQVGSTTTVDPTGAAWCLEVLCDVIGDKCEGRINGTSIGSTTCDWDRGGLKTLHLGHWSSSTGTDDTLYDAIEIRTDRWPGTLPNFGDSKMISWTENQTFHTSATLYAGQTAEDTLDLANGNMDRALVIQTLTFDTPPTDGHVEIESFFSVDSGTTLTSFPRKKLVGWRDVGEKLMTSLDFEEPYVKVLTKNLTNQDCTYVGLYAGRQQS